MDLVVDPSPITLNVLFCKKAPAQITRTLSLRHGSDVTSHELSLCASKFTYFTQFYANIRALKPSIRTSPEKETRRERDTVSGNMALAPDP